MFICSNGPEEHPDAKPPDGLQVMQWVLTKWAHNSRCSLCIETFFRFSFGKVLLSCDFDRYEFVGSLSSFSGEGNPMPI
jgi:hypothetical protein